MKIKNTMVSPIKKQSLFLCLLVTPYLYSMESDEYGRPYKKQKTNESLVLTSTYIAEEAPPYIDQDEEESKQDADAQEQARLIAAQCRQRTQAAQQALFLIAQGQNNHHISDALSDLYAHGQSLFDQDNLVISQAFLAQLGSISRYLEAQTRN